MKTLIKNGHVVRKTNSEYVVETLDIAIEENTIKDIGKIEEKGFDRIIDATNQVVIPGMINMHTHIPMKVLQGIGEGVRLDSWLKDHIWPIEGKMSEEDVYIAAKMAVIELLYSGVTCINEMYFSIESIAKALTEMGMRGMLSYVFFDFNISDETVDEGKKIIEKYRNSELIDISLGVHQLCDMKRENLEYLLKEFKGLTECLHIHVGESRENAEIIKEKSGKTPCEYLLTYDIEPYNVLAAHCVEFNSSDVDLLKEKRIYPINNPISNAKLANGISPVDEFIDKGIKACIGTDGSASNNSLNFLEEIKFGTMMQKVKYDNPMPGQPSVFFDIATINGAIALNKEREIGSIEIGKKADIVTFPIDHTMLPMHNVLSNLIYAGSSLRAANVMINGQMLITDGELGICDIDVVTEEFNKMTEKLMMKVKEG